MKFSYLLIPVPIPIRHKLFLYFENKSVKLIEKGFQNENEAVKIMNYLNVRVSNLVQKKFEIPD